MVEDKFLRISLGVIVLFVAGVILKLAKPILFPFFLAVFISYVIDPVMDFLIRIKFSRPAAVISTLLLAFILLYLLGALLYSSGKSFASGLPEYGPRVAELGRSLERVVGGLSLKLRISAFVESVNVERIASWVLSALGPFLDFVSKFLLVFLFLVFIVSGRGRALAKLRRALTPADGVRATAVVEAINTQIRRYLVIKTLMSLANGIIVWLVLAAFGVDFALAFGFIALLLNFIPNIGSIIAAALRVGFALFQFGSLWVPFWILVITVGSDTVMGSFLEPKIMGKGLGLSPLVVLCSLLFWGWLWGIPGMILAVPLTAVVKIVCQNVPSLRPVAVLMGN